MVDMWPAKTFRNWGSSSRLVRRKNAPSLVTRGSFFTLRSRFHSAIWPASRYFSKSSASATIVRNLNMRNGLPHSPRRCWVKMGEPPMVAAMTAHKMHAGMKPTTMTSVLKTRSMARLAKR